MIYALSNNAKRIGTTLPESLSYIGKVTLGIRDWGLLLWDAGSANEVRTVCRYANYPPMETITASIIQDSFSKGADYAGPGTLAGFLAVHNPEAIKERSLVPHSLAVYYVAHSLSPKGSDIYFLQYADISGRTLRFPTDGQLPWDIDTLLMTVNRQLITIGRLVK